MSIEVPDAPARPTLSDSKRALLEKRMQGKKATAAAPARQIPPRPAAPHAPLSYAQQRLWFMHQLDSNGSAYHMYLAWWLDGAVEPTALNAALNHIIQRHESLRTVYQVVEESPVQVILPEASIVVAEQSVTHIEETQRDAAAVAAARTDLNRPFDLTSDIPLRALLVHTAENRALLLVSFHHIAADALSAQVFTQELEHCYNAHRAGVAPSLPPLPIQYADFAVWQTASLKELGKLTTQLDYWKAQLADLPALLELPTDRPRPAVMTYHGAVHSFTLDAATTQKLKAVSQQHHVTPYMTLLALFQTLLHRYSRHNDIAVGSPVASRPRPELEGLIGLFINTVVLRGRFTPRLTVSELLTATRETLLSAYANQELPFEKLVDELKPERNLSYTPLYQAQFVYHNAPDSNPALVNVRARHTLVGEENTKFDLTLTLTDDNGELTGQFAYKTDLFNAETVARMQATFSALVTAALANPSARVAELPLLDATTAQTILQTWNSDTLTADMTPFHARFSQQAQRTPERIALACEGTTLTYREVEARANRVAHALQARGVTPDSRVALFADRSTDLVVGLLGIAKAGGAYVPIDPVSPPDRVGYMVAEAQGVVMLTQRHLVKELPALTCEVLVLDDPITFAGYPVTPPPDHVTGANLAYILFTSGSTGRPKGVAVEHRQITDYLDGIVARLDFPDAAHHAIISTFAADLGNTVLFPALCNGGTLHIIPYERATDPMAVADYFSRHPIDCLKIVPSHFEALLTAPNPAAVIPHKRLIFGGEASKWEMIERIRALRPECQIFNHYGPTETTVGVITYPVPVVPATADESTLPLGRPLPNTRLYVLDGNLQPLPVGVPGELYIGGDGVTRGYLNRPALSAERFIPDPFHPHSGARMYKTGDLVRYLANGLLDFLGRTDHQVKIRGYRIELGEIEALLAQHPTVHEVVLVVREDSPNDKRLVAYITQHTPTPVADLRNYLRDHLPDYMVPSQFVVLDAIPLTPNGKVDRRALPIPTPMLRDTGEGFTAPRTRREQEIAALWAEVLGGVTLGIDDNFFDVGGDSFKAIRVVRKLGVSVMTLFKFPTIRALAESLETPASQGGASLLYELTKPIDPTQRALSLVCVPYGGASAVCYQPLADALPSGMSLYAVDLPGHDFSRPDDALQSLSLVAERVVKEIQQTVTGKFSLYGHCVGTALTVEIARQLEVAGLAPQTVYLAGSFPAPRLPGKVFEFFAKIFSQDRMVSDRVYRDFLKGLGGFQEEFSPEELKFVMRNMRHDFNNAEAYFTQANLTPDAEMPKLATPVVCIAGEKDRSAEFYEERVNEWEHFAHSVNLAVVRRAGHFFLKHQAGSIARIIADQEELLPVGTPPTPPAQRHVYTKDEPAPSLGRFGVMALGQLVSMIGTGLTSFALGIWIYQRTGNVSDFAMISLFALLPGILMLPIAGAVVDRFDRRKVMIAADLVAGVRTLGLAALFFSGNLELWHIYLAAFIGSMCGAFQRPAYVAAVAQLVPKRYLGHANGIAELGTAAGTSIAPLLAGAAIGMVGLAGVLFLDFISFLLAITMLTLVRFPNSLFRKREEPLLQEIVNGWKYVTERRGLMAMVVFFCASNLLLAMMTVLITPLGLSLGSETEMGTAMAIGESGLIVGSLLMGVWGGTARRAEGMILFVAVEGIFMMLMGAYPSLAWLAAGLFGFNLCLAMSNGHWQALIQTQVPFQLHGRVFATNQMLAWSMMPLGYLLAGPMNDHVFAPLLADGGFLAASIGTWFGMGMSRGMGLFLIVIGLLTMVIGYLGYRYRPLRFMESEMGELYTDTLLAKDVDATELVMFQPSARVA